MGSTFLCNHCREVCLKETVLEECPPQVSVPWHPQMGTGAGQWHPQMGTGAGQCALAGDWRPQMGPPQVTGVLRWAQGQVSVH